MIDLNDALEENFSQAEVFEVVKSEDQEKKFKLGIQFIFKTNCADLGWALLNKVELTTLIDEKFIKDLLVPNRPEFSPLQVIKFLDFVYKKESKALNMAIQKHLVTYTQQKIAPNQGILTMNELMQIIEYLEKIPKNNPNLVPLLTFVVKNLAKIQLPREAHQLGAIRLDILRIENLFKDVQISNEDRFAVVETVYQQVITLSYDPQALVAIGFLIIPTEMISQAIEYFIKLLQCNGNKIRESIVIAMKRLILWQRSASHEVPLDVWISRTIGILNTNGYNDIIDQIAKENIAPAFISLLIPIFQVKMLNIVQVLLDNAKNTKELFDIIVPRCTTMLKRLEETKSEIVEQLMDLICETLVNINETDLKYRDLINLLEARNRSPSKYVSKKMIGPTFAGCLTSNARVGLENLGNTCYLNSILQALFMTKQFCRDILVTERFEDRAVLAMQELFALMLFSPRPEQNPRKVVNLIRPDDFLPGIQHDSSEFLGSLLDRLHELEKKRMKNLTDEKTKIDDEDWDSEELATNNNQNNSNNDDGSNSSSSDSGIQSMEIDVVDCGKTEVNGLSVSNDKIVDNTVNILQTYIQRIFGGKISTRYLCSSCNGNSINIDSFRDLQLSFPEKTANNDENESDAQYNVQKLLEFYFTSEELTLLGDNQYHCDNCKILCNGIRCTEILEPPRNLILTLKHFRYDSRHHTRSKLLYKVFHDEIISVNVKGSFSSNSTRSVDYKLYAAVIHSGTSLDSGHYFTIARECDKWFKFNDSYVTKSSLEELRSLISPNTPYILFYQRLSTASSTIVNESASTSTSSLSNPMVNENSFPEYFELSSVLQNLIDDDKTQFELEMMKNQQNVSHHHIIPSRHNPDNDRGSSGSSGFNMDNYPRFIY